MNNNPRFNPVLEVAAPAQSLKEHTISLSLQKEEDSLILEEENLNKVLEELPNFFIKGQHTPKKMLILKESVILTLAWSGVPVGIALALFLDRSIGNDVGSFLGALAILVTGIISLSGAMLLGNLWEKKIKAPENKKRDVSFHQQLITRSLRLTPSSFLKGRLSEIFFLCDSPDIDQKFWRKLVPALKKFCEEQEGKTNIVEIKKLQSSYREKLHQITPRITQ